VPITEEMTDTVMTYVSHVRQLRQAYVDAGAVKVSMQVEVEVPIDHLTGEKDARGTSDCVLVAEWADGAVSVTVADFKGGRGVAVDAVDNGQLQMYALGALVDLELLYPIRDVTLVISQPRLSSLPSLWSRTPEELEAFALTVKAAADATRASPSLRVPGKSQCRLCRAKHDCPALAEKVQREIGETFEDLTANPDPGLAELKAALLSSVPEVLSEKMKAVELIEGWCKAIRAAVERNLLSGVPVPGFKLVQGRKGARKWADEAIVEKLLRSHRFKHAMMYDYTLISPTTAEKRF
jgi:hypothetical protein